MMSGREKIEAAMSPAGTPEWGVVIPYESLCYRDHWSELTDKPWWWQFDPDPERQLGYQRDLIAGVPQDWMGLPASAPRSERDAVTLEPRADGVYRVDRRTGRSDRLERPQVGGWSADAARNHSVVPTEFPRTRAEVERMIPDPLPFDRAAYRMNGALDLPVKLMDAFPDRMPTGYVISPLWRCYHLWGFEGLMTQVLDAPELVRFAAERYLAAALPSLEAQAARGIRAVWIEECFTDMIAPDLFVALNMPLMRRLIDAIHQQGMASIYYYCGDPGHRLEALVGSGTDVLGLEEGKKGFTIDLRQVAEAVRGRCALLGNLDAIGCLEQQDEAGLRAELKRQAEAGRLNRNRFIFSLGSPVTPGTPMDKLRRYFDIARDIAGGRG